MSLVLCDNPCGYVQLFNGSGMIPEQTGDSSMCFELDAGGRSQAAVCLSYECIPGGVNVSVAGQEVFCRFGDTVCSMPLVPFRA